MSLQSALCLTLIMLCIHRGAAQVLGIVMDSRRLAIILNATTGITQYNDKLAQICSNKSRVQIWGFVFVLNSKEGHSILSQTASIPIVTSISILEQEGTTIQSTSQAISSTTSQWQNDTASVMVQDMQSQSQLPVAWLNGTALAMIQKFYSTTVPETTGQSPSSLIMSHSATVTCC